MIWPSLGNEINGYTGGFINSGWEFSGQATSAAKTENKGGSMGGATSVSDGVDGSKSKQGVIPAVEMTMRHDSVN